MDKTTILVFKTSSLDFLHVNAGHLPQVERFLAQGGVAIVRMRGLPFNVTKCQIYAFFEGINIVNGQDGIFMIRSLDGRATGSKSLAKITIIIWLKGDAFVILQSEDDAVQALGRHKANIGERYVEVFRSTGAELHQVYLFITFKMSLRSIGTNILLYSEVQQVHL